MNPPFEGLRALDVSIHGRRAGTIHWLHGERHLFAIDPDYASDPKRPTLSLSFKGRDGNLMSRARPYTRRLPPFFSNLLPEGHLREYLAQIAGVHPGREFFLLAALGRDLTGATVVAPAAEALDTTLPVGAALPPPTGKPEMRFSLAGVQLKFSAVMEASGGLTIPAQGVGGAWIVKLPSLRFQGVPENEYAMLELARATGIRVPETRLVPISEIRNLPAEAARMEGRALVVRRFDRSPLGYRIHMEDFAQVFDVYPEDKYKRASYGSLARVLWPETGISGVVEFARRLAFTVLIGNGDMHLKNWSLLYADGFTPELAPAYDFVSTLPYMPGDQLGLSLGGSRSLAEMTHEQIYSFIQHAGLPTKPIWDAIWETVERIVPAWQKLPQRQFLLPWLDEAIDAQIRRVAASAPVRTTRYRQRPKPAPKKRTA